MQLRIGNTDVPNQIISNDGSYIVTALKYVPGGTGTVGIKLGSLVLTQRAVGITRDCDIQRSCVYTIQLID